MPDVLAPLAAHLFTGEPDAPRLLGSRCAPCDVTTFPVQSTCPRCGRGDLLETEYRETGTLWTFTIQNFPPKSPPYAGVGEFIPYAVGYVEFAGQGLVEGRIDCADPESLAIGMPMRVRLCAFESAGGARSIHCFRPLAEDGG
ncbi:Zn-ribbon domain-containing OB-fold protein [Nocardia puris]|uniref:Putative OB-fold protein n=1 Tax=Nocardia puris TaxID=208602 RepID=A0A366E415_9NOCA|nr:OB-fold domain-containing protein [Nocardia puris]RBO96148.1 putative OB-fold protein [Nocardia puris]